MADFELVIGDTPTIPVTCETSTGGVKDLTGASAVLIVRDPNSTTVTFSHAVTITDPPNGKVSYTFGATDFTNAGFYVAQVKVTYTDGTVETFPDPNNAAPYITILVRSSLTATALPTGFGSSVQTLLDRTLAYLNGRTRPVRNKLNGAIGITDTTLTLAYDPKLLTANSVLSIGLETLHVWETQGKVVTVERGMDGSTALTHDDKSIIHVDPEYTAWSIFDAINQELLALSSRGVWQIKSVDLTLVDGTVGYDLASDVIKVLDVSWQDPTDSSRWTELQGWDLVRNLDTTTFPSGTALMVPAQWREWWSRTRYGTFPGKIPVAVRVRYAAPLGTLSTGFDDVADTGIPDTAVDILPLGAAIRVGAGRAVQRVQVGAQPDPRDAQMVRVQDVLNAWAALRQDHDRRISEEADRLARQFPYRIKPRSLRAM